MIGKKTSIQEEKEDKCCQSYEKGTRNGTQNYFTSKTIAADVL